ncbi:MAG: endonuclease/exonuclease/phosphatase family protein [Candidatus Paceibacterota bacterium]
MKLITLNVWGGLKEQELVDFFQQKKGEVDIFCLQEVNHDAEGKNSDFPDDNHTFLADTAAILEGYDYYFYPSIEDHYGLASFVRKGIKVVDEGDEFVSGEHGQAYDLETDKDHARNVQFLEIEEAGANFLIHNFHGMWTKEGKIDTPKRIQQAKNIANHLKDQKLPQIIAGDFNSRPDTQSMKIIEEAGLRNLVKEYGVTDTRTGFYEKEERFADYILVSDGVQVNDFKVLPDEVSDHAPLYLDFAIM